MTKNFKPIFTITNRITAGLTRIERVRGFLEAACLRAPHRQATLSVAWVRTGQRKGTLFKPFKYYVKSSFTHDGKAEGVFMVSGLTY
jgi:hypothetical protein